MTATRRSGQALLLFLLVWLTSGPANAENNALDDLFLGVWSPFTAKWEASIPVCVWTDSAETLYKISATGQQAGVRYYVSNDIGDLVSYSVFWHFGRNLKRREKLKSGVQSRWNYPYSSNRQCSDGNGTQIRVKLNNNQITDAPPGIYNDTLLLVFSPI